MKDTSFQQLYEIAKTIRNPRTISPTIEAGEVSAALLTEAGNVYTGVCIDTACSLGMCAERNAIANMITNGESKITKLICIKQEKSIILPCGACRENMMQLDKDSGDIEILRDINTMETIKLSELIPHWWGE